MLSNDETRETMSDSSYIDEIDKRVIHSLAIDARNTSAPMIADEVDVSSGTIRNRIQRLETEGTIGGYHADIRYKEIEGMITTLFACEASISDLESRVTDVLDIPGVINVRELLSGRENLQVQAVGKNVNDLRRIATELSDLNLEIVHEHLVQREFHRPYQPFGPDGTTVHE